MTLRMLKRIVPVAAALALAAPAASADAAMSPATGPAAIPCYPFPAFCGPDGQPWWRVQPIGLPLHLLPLPVPVVVIPPPAGPAR
jgi:hypothetical protein